jgi:hypothetical protein
LILELLAARAGAQTEHAERPEATLSPEMDPRRVVLGRVYFRTWLTIYQE